MMKLTQAARNRMESQKGHASTTVNNYVVKAEVIFLAILTGLANLDQGQMNNSSSDMILCI